MRPIPLMRDNHDTGPSPPSGGQNHWPFPADKVLKSNGITSTSTVSIQVADSSRYAAIITGNSGKVAMKMVPANSFHASTPHRRCHHGNPFFTLSRRSPHIHLG
jgi:hypothetical protein